MYMCCWLLVLFLLFFAVLITPEKPIYYLASMTIKNSKSKSNIRNQVYEIASSYAACYYIGKNQSIFYEDSNLQIRLLFESWKIAHQFVNAVMTMLNFHHIAYENNKSYEKVQPSFEITLVFRSDYDPADYPDSATRSTVVTEIPLANQMVNDEDYMMAIERKDSDEFCSGYNPYKCHIIGQAVDKTYAESKNNIFFMSWGMHQRFDGLNSVPKKCPSIAIRYVDVGKEKVMVGSYERQQAILAIECKNKPTYDYVLNRVKHPYTPNPAGLEITTFVYPEDIQEFIYCIQYKYEETKAVWADWTPGTTIDDALAAEVRTNASKAVKARLQKLKWELPATRKKASKK